MQKQITAIRKSFDQLSENEYEHYFYVVRLLHIFAPDKQDVKQYQFTRKDSQVKTPVTPKCMYDAFIAMHATCCEHRTEVFPYWHRWLMIRYQQYLLKAHRTIISPNLVQDQTDRLLQLAQKVNPNTTQKEIQDLLNAMQRDYLGITGGQQIKYIPAHYWNVFQPTKKVHYPLGYISKEAYPKKSYDNIDELIKKIWDQDSIFQINFTTRYEAEDLGTGQLIQPNSQYQKYDKLLENTDFWAAPQNHRQKIPEAYQFIVEKQSKYLEYKQSLKRQTPDKGQNLNKLIFNVLDHRSVNFVFGGNDYNYYPDIKPIDPDDKPPQTTTDPDVFKGTRNNNIGYYAYCRSLYTTPTDFITKFTTVNNDSNELSMQNPHNSMHNNQQYCMNDSSFSVTNPIFFAYHSLIDLMLEYKIDSMKNIQPEESQAASSISSYLKSDFTIHNSEFNLIFKHKWLIQQKNNNAGSVPKNQDYPVLKWISEKGKKVFDKDEDGNIIIEGNITNDDYAEVVGYTYTKLLLDGNKLRNLSNIKPETHLSYSIQTFNKDIKQIKSHVQNPYSSSNLYVALQIRYRSAIQSTNLNIQLKNMDGKILTTKTYPIFSRGKNGKCPNCTQFITNKVLFRVEELKGHFSNLINIRQNGIFEESAYSQVESRINLASSISYNLSHKDVTARFVSGRENLNIFVKNYDKEIKVYLKSEEKQRSKSKAIETFRSKKPVIFNAINGADQKKVGTKLFNIIGAQAQLNGKTINYNFQFFSEESEIVFDFGKHEDKIGLSKPPCIGQTLNNVYEITQESIPEKKIQKIIEEKAEVKVKPKVEKITLTYADFE